MTKQKQGPPFSFTCQHCGNQFSRILASGVLCPKCISPMVSRTDKK